MMKRWVTKALAILVIVTLLTATFAGSADELDAVEVVFDDVTLEEIAEADDELILDGINGDSMAGIVIDDIELETAEEGVSERTEQNDPDDVASNALPDEITLGIKETFKLSYRKGWYYSSSDNEIATVSNEGLITAKKRGKATITVKDRDKNVVAKCAVTVKKLPGRVDLNKKNMNLTEGCTYQLEASFPKNTYTSRLTWSSNNKKVAKVSKTGLVTAVKPGKATITVRTGNNKKAKCVVNVIARRELSKYLGWYTKSVVKSIGMKYNHRYTYEEGEDTTISVDVYSKVFTDGGALYIESEDKEHIDDIEFTSIKVAYDGIYVGMNKSQAIMAAKAKGWMKSGSDTTYIQYYNDQGHHMYVGLNDGDRRVNYVRVDYDEAFKVIFPEYTSPDGEYHPGTDYIIDDYEILPTSRAGDVWALTVSSNVDWKVSQTEATANDWLSLSTAKANSGTTELDLTINKVPNRGKKYSSKLVFTTRSGRKYTRTVTLKKNAEARVELKKAIRGDLNTYIDKLGLSYEKEMTYEERDAEIRCCYYSKYDEGCVLVTSEDERHIDYLYVESPNYMVWGIYAGMSRKDAVKKAKAGGWTEDDVDDSYCRFVNTKQQSLFLWFDNDIVESINVLAPENIDVLRRQWEDAEGGSIPERHLMWEDCELAWNAPVGSTEVLAISSNSAWKVAQQDATVSGWLGLSAKQGKEGNTKLTLTVKKVPNPGETYYTTLVFTLESGRKYYGTVWLSGDDAPEPVSVTGVSLDDGELFFVVGDTFWFSANVTPDDATDRSVTWESSNPSVAGIDADGMLTARSAGDTVVTVTTNDGGYTDTCEVHVDELYPTEVALDAEEQTLYVGDQVKLTATVYPANATAKQISWSSSDTSVATVNDGVVTAKGEGMATITAMTENGLEASCTVTVIPALIDISSVTMSATTLSMKVGDTETLVANPFPLGAAVSSDATWNSSNTAVATVNSKGKVTAKGEGTATITATIVSDLGTSRTGKCTVTVSKQPVSFSVTHQSLSGTTLTMNPDAVAGHYSTLKVTSNTAWTATLSSDSFVKFDSNGVSSSAHVSSTKSASGAANTKLNLRLTIVNPPAAGKTSTATVTFNVGGTTKKYTVKLTKPNPASAPKFTVTMPDKTISIGDKWIVDANVSVTGGSGCVGKVSIAAYGYDNSMMSDDFSGHQKSSISTSGYAAYRIDTSKAPWNVPGTYKLRLWALDSNGNKATSGTDEDGAIASMTLTIVEESSYYSAKAIYDRMDDLYNKLGGPGYFTVNRKSCTSSFVKGHSCSNCFNENVINTAWFKDEFGTVSCSSFPTSYRGSTEYTQKGWSCLGFSHFAEYWLYRDPNNPSAKVSTKKIGTYAFNYTNAAAYAHTGDLIGFDSYHSAICYYSDNSGMYVLDCNWGLNGKQCRVDKHYIPYSKYTNFTIARAYNAQ